MVSHLHSWIVSRLEELPGKNQAGLAAALTLDRSGVTRIIKGERQIKSEEISVLAGYLEMTEGEVLARIAKGRRSILDDGFIARPIDIPAQSQMPRSLPVYGQAVGGIDGAFEMNGSVIDYVEMPPSLAGVKNAYGVYVQGESMSPRYEPGWLVHVHPYKPPRRDDNVVIQIKPKDEFLPPLAYVKVFVSWTKFEGKLVARQFNPPKELEWSSEDVVSVHKIVGVAHE